MVVNELETGLFLDLKIQQWLQRYFAIPADQMSIINNLHGSEYELVFEQVAMSLTPLNTRTILVNNVEHRVKLYVYEGKLDFAHVYNKDEEQSTFVIRQRDVRSWDRILNKLLKSYYI